MTDSRIPHREPTGAHDRHHGAPLPRLFQPAIGGLPEPYTQFPACGPALQQAQHVPICRGNENALNHLRSCVVLLVLKQTCEETMTDWTLYGTYAEVGTASPVTLPELANGNCTALVGWHIDKGHYNRVCLDGLNVAVGVRGSTEVNQRKWTAVLYIDHRADAAQRIALSNIFGGRVGGDPARLARHVASVIEIDVVPILFKAGTDGGHLVVGRVGEAEWRPMTEPDGRRITLDGNPQAIAPDTTATISYVTRARLQDRGLSFVATGRKAVTAPFAYTGT